MPRSPRHPIQPHPPALHHEITPGCPARFDKPESQPNDFRHRGSTPKTTCLLCDSNCRSRRPPGGSCLFISVETRPSSQSARTHALHDLGPSMADVLSRPSEPWSSHAALTWIVRTCWCRQNTMMCRPDTAPPAPLANGFADCGRVRTNGYRRDRPVHKRRTAAKSATGRRVDRVGLLQGRDGAVRPSAGLPTIAYTAVRGSTRERATT